MNFESSAFGVQNGCGPLQGCVRMARGDPTRSGDMDGILSTKLDARGHPGDSLLQQLDIRASFVIKLIRRSWTKSSAAGNKQGGPDVRGVECASDLCAKIKQTEMWTASAQLGARTSRGESAFKCALSAEQLNAEKCLRQGSCAQLMRATF